MATATIVSRVTGFVRTLALVAALGLGTQLLDAYTAASVTPNTIYELVFGGALASVLVPLLVRTAANGDIDDDLFAQRLLSLVVYGLGAVVIVTIIAAPFIVDLYVPGFSPDQRQLAVVLTRYFMPQILFYGVSATLAAILNARSHFIAPMWAPVANNLVVIATASIFLLIGGTGKLESLTHVQLLLLSIGTSAGVAAQMIVLALVSRRTGFRLRLRADPRGIGVRRIVALAGWTITSVAAAQAVFVVITRIASQAGPGAVSVYSNAYTLFQLPYAVIAVTVITAVLPRMSRAAANRDLAQVTAELSQSLRLTGVVLVPIAAALIVLGPQLTTVLFAHGNASPAATHLTGSVLAAYGLALVPFAGYQIMSRVFYALGDTRTPERRRLRRHHRHLPGRRTIRARPEPDYRPRGLLRHRLHRRAPPHGPAAAPPDWQSRWTPLAQYPHPDTRRRDRRGPRRIYYQPHPRHHSRDGLDRLAHHRLRRGRDRSRPLRLGRASPPHHRIQSPHHRPADQQHLTTTTTSSRPRKAPHGEVFRQLQYPTVPLVSESPGRGRPRQHPPVRQPGPPGVPGHPRAARR
ncbi:murein biosynthesis integral membrane protein MurJ [Nonomuraea sp. NPDC002799]